MRQCIAKYSSFEMLPTIRIYFSTAFIVCTLSQTKHKQILLPCFSKFFSLVDNNATGRDVLRYQCASTDNTTFSNSHTIQDCHITSNPTVILNSNSFSLDSLTFDAALCIREHMIFCKQTAFRAKHHILADSDFSRTAYISVWSNRAVFSHRQADSIITTIIA